MAQEEVYEGKNRRGKGLAGRVESEGRIGEICGESGEGAATFLNRELGRTTPLCMKYRYFLRITFRVYEYHLRCDGRTRDSNIREFDTLIPATRKTH